MPVRLFNSLLAIQHTVTSDTIKAKPEDQMTGEELDDSRAQVCNRKEPITLLFAGVGAIPKEASLTTSLRSAKNTSMLGSF